MLQKITSLCFLLFILYTSSNAQSITSLNLLNNITSHWEFLEQLRDDLSESTNTKYTARLEQSYTFIILELRNEEDQSFLEIKYRFKSEKELTLYSFYCDNKEIAHEIELRAKQLLTSFKWSNKASKEVDNSIITNEFKLTKEQIHYLEIADRIAMVGNDIYTYPSFYNSFILTDHFIKLVHINDRNSRSIDHKDNYFLRDLYFFIPLNDNTIKKDTYIDSYFIGAMEVLFQDNSTKPQKATGNQIILQIKEEIENYK